MRIGIAAKNEGVSEHFGKSDALYIYFVNESFTSLLEIIRVDQHEHEGFPKIVVGSSIDVLICGGLGMKAKNRLQQESIEVISGVSGPVEMVFELYLKNKLVSTEEVCSGHNHNHEHHHD